MRLLYFDMSLHFLFACMPGFHRSCSPLHSLFNPNIQTKIKRIFISNNSEHLLIPNFFSTKTSAKGVVFLRLFVLFRFFLLILHSNERLKACQSA